MTATTLNSPLRKQAGASIDAVATEIQDAVRQELDALRSSMTVRLVALDRVLSRDQNDPAFEPVIQQLCEIAAEQAEAASAWARAQAEEAAARELAAVRGQARAELDAAQAQSEAARLELAQRLAKAEAGAAETARALADLRAQTDAARSEFAQHLAQSEAASNVAALALAEAERVAAAARHDADRGAASLEDARRQIDAIERGRADLLLARDIAEAHLEGEVHHRNAIAAELEVVREQALHARADADAGRLEWQRVTDRIRVLEERLRQRDAESSAATSSEARAVLSQVRSALQRLTSATTGHGLLDAVLELLAEHFSRVALCAIVPQGLRVWGSRGFDPPLRKAMIPLTADSPLTRALADRKPATVKATDGEGLSGLSDSPISYAIALPIVTKDRCEVILYAENSPEASNGNASVGEKIAEILADRVSQRVRSTGTASEAEPSRYAPTRQARRVKILESINVAVDGAPGTLVDLSTLGAQVVSPRAIRPNRSVRLLLPSDQGGLSCEARVVWVCVEQGQANNHALYRAGVQFTDVDAPELDAFFSQHSIFEPAIRH
jgi:PilZ domain